MRRIKSFIVLLSIFFGMSSFAQESDLFKGNDKKPLEITADQLEVYKKEEKAIFSGNVLAKQGNVSLSSQEMIIYYKADKAKGKKSSNSDPKNSVSKVEANGRIFLSTPTETAQGNKGIYDVEKRTIRILGNVSLTSGKSIVKGDEMVYNLDTGQSKMISSGQEGQSSVPAANKQRVRGVFVPE